MSDRSLELAKLSLTEGCKYDYFIVGISSAIFAYFAKNFSPEAFGLNESTFILCALISLVISIICGLKSIEINNLLFEKNGEYLELNAKKAAYIKNVHEGKKAINTESGEILEPESSAIQEQSISRILPTAKADLEKMLKHIRIYHWFRDYGLFMGLGFLACSKLYPAFWS